MTRCRPGCIHGRPQLRLPPPYVAFDLPAGGREHPAAEPGLPGDPPHQFVQGATAGHLVMSTLDDDKKSHLVVTDLDGGNERELPLPGDGTVTDLQYLGADSRIRVQLEDGSHLLANVPSDGLVGVVIGEPLRLAWSRHAAFTVADTYQGGDE